MNAQAALAFQDPLHENCIGSRCKITCLVDLELHLTLYLNELDRVFFNKENQHNRESWWLSTFYSFCIQGIVRGALMNIFQLFKRNLSGVTQYLHLAVRLFIAVSSSYDPLIQNISSNQALSSKDSENAIFNNRCKVAQIAVRQGEWESKGINGSAEYLKQLFEDRGDVLVKDVGHANEWSEFYS